VSNPHEFEIALMAYVDFHSGRAAVERPDAVRSVFPGAAGDDLVREIQRARVHMESVDVSGLDPLDSSARAEAHAKIAAVVPGMTPRALGIMLDWWTKYNLWG
jgi:hypothetical protein